MMGGFNLEVISLTYQAADHSQGELHTQTPPGESPYEGISKKRTIQVVVLIFTHIQPLSCLMLATMHPEKSATEMVTLPAQSSRATQNMTRG